MVTSPRTLEAIMHQSANLQPTLCARDPVPAARGRKTWRAVALALAVSVIGGCAMESESSQANSSSEPELAGAWYQIYFDTNKIEIDSRGQMIIKTVATLVANEGSTHVTVIGKADRVGLSSANISLSQRRADHVRDALIAAGVPSARIDTSWTGESKPEVATVNDASERRNRVVDVTVVKLPRR
jgi:OOP family OmpA-OmpF porin